MTASVRYADDVSPGDELPSLVRGPITTAHIMRWSAAMESWHRIHHDWHLQDATAAYAEFDKQNAGKGVFLP